MKMAGIEELLRQYEAICGKNQDHIHMVGTYMGGCESITFNSSQEISTLGTVDTSKVLMLSNFICALKGKSSRRTIQ